MHWFYDGYFNAERLRVFPKWNLVHYQLYTATSIYERVFSSCDFLTIISAQLRGKWGDGSLLSLWWDLGSSDNEGGLLMAPCALWQSWNRALVVAGGPSQNTPLICTSDLGRKGNGMWGFNFCLPTGKISRQLFSAQPQSFSLKMNNFLRKDRAKNVQFTSVECSPLWALSLLY